VQHLQTELTEMSRKVQAAQAGLHDYIGAITSAQEEERSRLARELHDDTIQAVIALKQRVQLAQRLIQDQNGRQSLKDLEALAHFERALKVDGKLYLAAYYRAMLLRGTTGRWPLNVPKTSLNGSAKGPFHRRSLADWNLIVSSCWQQPMLSRRGKSRNSECPR
jgi:hypothetical protein